MRFLSTIHLCSLAAGSLASVDEISSLLQHTHLFGEDCLAGPGKCHPTAKVALLVIDVQDCFLDKDTTSGKPGSLSVPASHIIEIVNRVREEKSCWFDEVIFSQDFHPSNHISFGSTHGLAPFSHLGGKGSLPLRCIKSGKDRAAACCPTSYVSPSDVDCTTQLCPPEGWNYTVSNPGIINGNKACSFCKENPTECFDTHQAMWTDHCLATGDATFPPKLIKKENDVVIKKGTNQFVDAYSAFMDNTHSYHTELAKHLNSKGIDTIFVVGIATDVCVYETVRDAIEQVPSIKNVYVIKDATAPVLGNMVNFDAKIDDMQFLGANVFTSQQVHDASCDQNVHQPPPPEPATCGGKSALLVIDVQDCFLEKDTTTGKPGSLSVPSSHVIPLINQIRDQKSCLFDHVIFSQDYHPANHISFGSTHGLAPFSHSGGKGALPMMCIRPSLDPWLRSAADESAAACCPTAYVAPQNVDCTKQLCPPDGWNYTVNNPGIVDGNKACTLCKEKPEACYETHQSMWTDHCLATGDSTFPPTLKKEAGDITVRKGENQFVDAYSAFMDNSHSVKTALEAKLAELCIDTLYVVGIATDVCVRETVMDAFSHIPGVKKVTVIKDATAAVLGNQVNFDNSIDEMQSEGATIVTVAELLAQDCPAA